MNGTSVRVLKALARLCSEGVIVPIQPDGKHDRLWSDCMLAALAENRLGEVVDPRKLSNERRKHWLERATFDSPGEPPSARGYERCFWILANQQRVGTLAIGTSTQGSFLVEASSLYVLPPYRGKGWGRTALRVVCEELVAQGLGLKLSTCWTWQRTVRTYLRMGMWLRMWKHDLQFCWEADQQAPHITFEGDVARLSVNAKQGPTVIVTAERQGDRLLRFDEVVEMTRPYSEEHWLNAPSTLALAIALAGWPLVRSSEDWESSHWSDFGAPEALASRIQWWEAWDRKRAWQVDAPRIPGLKYPSWSTLTST